MSTPEEAIERARRTAAEARARGEPGEGPVSFEVSATSRISDSRLAEWAIIEPDLRQVRSTRRLGAPITWFKRGVLRFLRQYLDQVLAQQSRFNAHVAAHVMSLDDRVRRLERLAGDRDEPPAPPS